jgi:MFS family permease
MVVLLLALLGFGWEQVLRSVIPLIVLERGGGAALVGIAAAVYSLPSLLFRPLIGRLVDSWHHGRLLLLGAIVAAVTPIGLLLPGILLLIPTRFVQGTGWATYSVSSQAFMAKIAPPDRRGTASGYYQSMVALALLVGPSLGTWLFVGMGLGAPVLVASALGFTAVLVAARVRIPVQADAAPAPAPTRQAARPTETGSRLRHVLEPAALPGTFMLATFMSGQALFNVFAPVYAISIGEPVESLVLYYPVYGAVLTLSQLSAGRISDRVGRALAVRVGSGIAIVALLVAGLGGGMATLTLGAGLYAVGVALVSSATSALTIDRAPQGRLGSAMATYSLGYQIAAGAGSLLWGAIIAVSGFLPAFLGAIAMQVLTVAATFRYGRQNGPRPAA